MRMSGTGTGTGTDTDSAAVFYPILQTFFTINMFLHFGIPCLIRLTMSYKKKEREKECKKRKSVKRELECKKRHREEREKKMKKR
jgi:hypothetical protein